MKTLGKYSIGMGDRFGHQGTYQLRAIIEAEKKGIEITPVWNKSNREHMIIGTEPADVRNEADKAAAAEGFKRPYFVDADHINADTVDRFIEWSDFFTIDVASFIGKPATEDEINEFVKGAVRYSGNLNIPGIRKHIEISEKDIRNIAKKYLFAAIKAWEIYRKIEKSKGAGNFITEVSMDEVATPQTPVELFFILKMLGEENIPVQTIAPKFSGRFNKGVDYVGDPDKFADEFEDDLMVIEHAVKEFGLPANLKISVHSGSDKFAIYPHIGRLIKKHNKGIHLKTAGTTWLEEVIGLAESGSAALSFVKEVYAKALEKADELCAPYADVIDINFSSLPSASEAGSWSGARFASALRHVPGNPDYNSDMRQLIHVGYKLAAMKMGQFSDHLVNNSGIVGQCVYDNLYHRHISRLFNLG